MPTSNPNLNKRELATILAALRNWQEGCLHELSLREIKTAFPQFEDAKPLTPAEVDALCEKLNAGD